MNGASKGTFQMHIVQCLLLPELCLPIFGSLVIQLKSFTSIFDSSEVGEAIVLVITAKYKEPGWSTLELDSEITCSYK